MARQRKAGELRKVLIGVRPNFDDSMKDLAEEMDCSKSVVIEVLALMGVSFAYQNREMFRDMVEARL